MAAASSAAEQLGVKKKVLHPPVEPERHVFEGQWSKLLALDVVEAEFGASTRAVAKALMVMGPSSMLEIKAYFQQKPTASAGLGSAPTLPRIRACLMVLILHQLVTPLPKSAPASRAAAAAAAEEEAAAGVGEDAANPNAWAKKIEWGAVRYRFELPRALQRLRIPRFLDLITRRYGAPATAIVQAIFQHGPRQQAKLLALAAETYGAELAAANEELDASALDMKTTGDLERAWAWLAREQFIVPSEGCRPHPARGGGLPHSLLATAIPISGSSSGGAGRGGSVGAAAAVAEDDAEIRPPPSKRARMAAAASSSSSSSSSSAALTADANALWRFNWGVANACLRNDLLLRHAKACTLTAGVTAASGAAATTLTQWRAVDAASSALGVLAVQAVLEASLKTDGSSGRLRDCEATQPMTLGQITQAVNMKRGARPGGAAASGRGGRGGLAGSSSGAPAPITPDRLKRVLLQLCSYPVPPISLADGSVEHSEDPSFVVRPKPILLNMQLTTIGDMLHDRYGDDLARRVVRLLLERGPMDEKNVSEYTLTPQKESRAMLFSLLKDRFVELQEVPRRADHHPQFTFYLFEASMSRLLRVAAEEAHHAVLNLRIRQRLEAERWNAATKAAEAGGLEGAPAVVVLYEQRRAAMEAVKRLREEAGVPVNSGGVLTVAEKEAITAIASQPHSRAAAALDVLEEANLRLLYSLNLCDDTLMLLRDLHVPDLDWFGYTPGDL